MKRLIVVAGPSAVGKTYLAAELLRKFAGQITQGQLMTTRRPRPGEERGTDRIFVSEQDFLDKQAAGDFFVAEQFHGNWYGYPRALLDNSASIMIINAWPELIPKFIGIPGVLLIGMRAADLSLLEKRLSNRGYDLNQMNTRLSLIRRDQKDLQAVANIIEQHGKLFTVTGDGTISEEIVPWLENRLK